MKRTNLPLPDQLAKIRAQITVLEKREAWLRDALIADPNLREGAAYLAKVTEMQPERFDSKEFRKVYPDLAAEYIFPGKPYYVVTLLGITEHGEIVPTKKLQPAK